VIAPHLTAAYRILDLLPVFDSDKRVQIMFTVPDRSARWPAVENVLLEAGGVVLPWAQAQNSTFDLAIAASYVGVDTLDAPVAIMPHGVSKVGSRRRNGSSNGSEDGHHGLHRKLLVRDGRLIPRVLLLSHESELQILADSCPEALDRAVVAGDPCYDRMVASISHRERFRAAFSVHAEQKLVVASTTWSQFSLFGTHPDVFDRLLDDLPSDEYRVAAILHPNVWQAHGSYQVRMWLAGAMRRGLILLPPEDGWRAALVAADCVIGDHGSVTQYAAALQRPIVINDASREDIRAGSVAELLQGAVPALNHRQHMGDQVRAAVDCWDADVGRIMAARITSRPGEAAAVMRREFYRILELDDPGTTPAIAPVSMPAHAGRAG
jgi:hypothetical protein